MTTLPHAENAVIPLKKFTDYVLHPIKSKGKHYAFEKVLGYTAKNADKLIENIRANLTRFGAVSKGDNGFGARYEVTMNLTGVVGRSAAVITAWIIEYGSNTPKLTSAYITKRRGFLC